MPIEKKSQKTKPEIIVNPPSNQNYEESKRVESQESFSNSSFTEKEDLIEPLEF